MTAKRKLVVRFKQWYDPAMEARFAREPDIELLTLDREGDPDLVWPHLSKAHAFQVSSAKDELPRNWFVTESVHPGACTVSQAILCADAGGTTRRVLDWAFEQRDAIVEARKADPTAAQRMIGERFPELAACIDTPAVKQRLNRGLRWVAARNLNTVVPQLYIAGTLLCPEANDEAALAGAVTALLSR